MSRLKDFFAGMQDGLRLFGYNLSIITNTVLLAIVYILGVGITAIASRIVRKRFLEKKPLKNKESYWSDLNLKKKPMEAYYRQF